MSDAVDSFDKRGPVLMETAMEQLDLAVEFHCVNREQGPSQSRPEVNVYGAETGVNTAISYQHSRLGRLNNMIYPLRARHVLRTFARRD